MHAQQLSLGLDRPSLPRGTRPCDRCQGSGLAHWYARGTLQRGKCFRCAGKGWQSRSDRARNWGYDRIAADRLLAADMRAARKARGLAY
jgi:DnaJ-class molecular chaperone